MRIAFDVDGVLRDLMGAYTTEIGRSVDELVEYGTAAALAGGLEPFLELLDHRACWRRAGVYPYMLGLCKQVESRGHTVVLVTAIATETGRQQTLPWLLAHDVTYDELHFCEDKLRVDFDAIVEDYPKNAYAAAKAGRAAFLVRRPWTTNSTLTHPNLFPLPDDAQALDLVWEVLEGRGG